jgi:hypothetical protein
MNPSSHEHISSEDLSAYLDAETSSEKKAILQAHLAECDDCRAEVAELTDLLRNQGRRRFWSIAIPTAAAASVAALMLVGPLRSGGEGDPTIQLRPGLSAEFEALPEIPVLSPEPGATVDPDQIEFIWAAFGENPSYRLTLADEGGDPLWTLETTRTRTSLPENVRLTPGGRYFWFVDALLPDGTTATTGMNALTVRR